jgi:hypothetical protein
VELTDLLARIAAAFERRKLPFMLIGGMGVSAWVEARLTRDVDITVLARKTRVADLRQALIDATARPTSTDMRVLFEGRWVRLKTGGPKLDVHLAVSAHDRTALENAERVRLGTAKVRVASPEDLVLHKLKAWRS